MGWVYAITFNERAAVNGDYSCDPMNVETDTEVWGWLKATIPNLSWMIEEDEQGFIDSLEYLFEYFDLSDGDVGFRKDRYGRRIAVVKNIEKVKEKLEEGTDKKISEAEEMLERKDIGWLLFTLCSSPFYFWVGELWEVCPEWRLFEILVEKQPREIFIVSSYRFK